MVILVCSSCNSSNNPEKLVEVYLKSWTDYSTKEIANPPRSSSICEECLVGWSVPAFRPILKQWEFGTVEAYNQETSCHSLRFMDDETERVKVGTAPFVEYIDHCKRVLLDSKRGRSSSLERVSTRRLETGRCSPFPYGNESKCFRPSSFFNNPYNDCVNQVSVLQHLNFLDEDETPLSMELNKDNSASSSGESPTGKKDALDGPSFDETSFDVKGMDTPPRVPKSCDSSSPKTAEASDSPRSYNQKLWTPEEDKLLLGTVSANDYNLKWPIIAKEIAGRTGKQCRERYLNHLKPSLKLTDWLAVEDALIFRLHNSEGSRWAMMSKVIRGRTDNSIKNRFHHLKRRLERQLQTVDTTKGMDVLMKKLKKSRRLQDVDLEKSVIKYLALHMSCFANNKTSSPVDFEYNFGPFRLSKGKRKFEFCARCGLVTPSAQTGRFVCKTTGWCETCTQVSPCVNGDSLRAVHSQKKDKVG